MRTITITFGPSIQRALQGSEFRRSAGLNNALSSLFLRLRQGITGVKGADLADIDDVDALLSLNGENISTDLSLRKSDRIGSFFTEETNIDTGKKAKVP